jgi:hypothetical protein
MPVRKPEYILGLISLLLPLLFIPASSIAAWQTEAVYAPKNFESFSRYALTFDQRGHQHVVYGGDHLYHAYHDGLQWNYETVDSSSGVGSNAAITLDTLGNIHIGYYDSVNKYLKYATNISGSWKTEYVQHLDPTKPKPLVHVDSSGNVHMIYPTFSGGLQHATNTSGSWVIERVGASTSAFAIDQAGNFHTVTCDTEDCNILNYNTYVSGEWVSETIGVLEFGGGLSSLTIGSDGKAHIFYYKNRDHLGNLRDLMYATNTSGTWVHEIVDGDRNRHSSTVVTPSGEVHISYHYSDSTTKQLRYAFRKDGTWTNEIVETRSNYVSGSSIDIDPSGNVHIAYQSADSYPYSVDILHAVRNSGQWRTETVDSDGTPNGDSSIVVDSTGKQHILYLDDTDATLYYSTNISGTWSSERIVTIGKYYRYHRAFAVDQNGKAHVSYFDDPNDAIQYATNSTGEWTIETVATSEDYGRSSIAVNSQGNVYITYYDWREGGSIVIADNTSGEWHVEPVGPGSYPVIALDGSGTVHIAYADSNILKYARYIEGSFVKDTVDDTVYISNVYGISIDSSGSTHILYDESRFIPCPFLCPPHRNLRYATNALGEWSWSIKSVEDCSGLAYNPSMAIDPYNFVHIIYETYDGLRYVTNTSGNWLIEAVINGRDMGRAPSIAIDSSAKAHISYYNEVNHDIMYGTNMHSTPILVPIPAGRFFYPYGTAYRPLIHHENPELAMPVYSCFDFVDSQLPDMHIGLALDRFAEGVDIYAAYKTSLDPATVLVMNADRSFSPYSLDNIQMALNEGSSIEGISPWMTNVTESLRLNVFTIPLTEFIPGTYYLYLLAAPTGSLNSYYLWRTYFVVR